MEPTIHEFNRESFCPQCFSCCKKFPDLENDCQLSKDIQEQAKLLPVRSVVKECSLYKRRIMYGDTPHIFVAKEPGARLDEIREKIRSWFFPVLGLSFENGTPVLIEASPRVKWLLKYLPFYFGNDFVRFSMSNDNLTNDHITFETCFWELGRKGLPVKEIAEESDFVIIDDSGTRHRGFCPTMPNEEIFSMLEECQSIFAEAKVKYDERFGAILANRSRKKLAEISLNALTHKSEHQVQRTQQDRNGIHPDRSYYRPGTVYLGSAQDDNQYSIPLSDGERVGALVYDGGDILYFLGYGKYKSVVQAFGKHVIPEEYTTHIGHPEVGFPVVAQGDIIGLIMFDDGRLLSQLECIISPELNVVDLLREWKKSGKKIEDVSVDWARERFDKKCMDLGCSTPIPLEELLEELEKFEEQE